MTTKKGRRPWVLVLRVSNAVVWAEDKMDALRDFPGDRRISSTGDCKYLTIGVDDKYFITRYRISKE